MKTLITTLEQSTESKIDKRFGRSQNFCIYNEETNEITFETNPNTDTQGGAGTKTAELMSEKGINKIISGSFGPKAKNVLDKLNIQLVEIEEDLTIQQIINKLK